MTSHCSQAWYLRVLGGLSIEPASPDDAQRDRLALMLQRRQTLVLLGVLATAGSAGLARDKLVELLWAEGDSARTRNALAQLLFRTRRALGAEAVTGRQTLRLNSRVIATDLAEFQRAVDAGHLPDAVARYAGPLLDGVELGDTAVLVRWVASERARLEHTYQTAAEHVNAIAPRRPNTRAVRNRVPARYGGRAAAVMVGVVLIALLAWLIEIGRGALHRPETVVVAPFDNETGDTSFDAICRLGASSIAVVLAKSHLADTLQFRVGGRAERGASAVHATLFRIRGDSLALFVQVVRPSDGRILMAERPLVVPTARAEELVVLARQRVLAYYSSAQSGFAGVH